MKNKPAGIIIVIIILAILGGAWFFAQKNKTKNTEPVACTMEAKLCPDGSYVGRSGPLCEFAQCPENPSLPQGYTLDSYKVEKVLDVACTKTTDCQTPPEYLLISRCPMTSLCLKNQCTVVCPDYIENNGR